MNDLLGRRAIVSGAARGIGLAIAKRLVAGGARVAIADINGDGVKAAAAELGNGCIGIACDVRSTADVTAAVAAAVDASARCSRSRSASADRHGRLRSRRDRLRRAAGRRADALGRRRRPAHRAGRHGPDRQRLAAAPAAAPDAVKQAIWAANAIIGRPYRYGGGHSRGFVDRGHDCSGTVSVALHGGELLDNRPSRARSCAGPSRAPATGSPSTRIRATRTP